MTILVKVKSNWIMIDQSLGMRKMKKGKVQVGHEKGLDI